jgi:hypothetical protein
VATTPATAAALHAAAALVALLGLRAEPSRVVLASAWVATVPVLGVLLAGLTLRFRGGGAPSFDDDPFVSTSPAGPASDPLPSREVLLGGGPERRREALAALSRRADGAAVSLLRWALLQRDPALALEAALALDAVAARHGERVDTALTRLRHAPSSDAALDAAEALVDTLHAGLIDAALVPATVAEARRCYAIAADLDPDRAGAVSERRVRLELAVEDLGFADPLEVTVATGAPHAAC